MIQKPSFQDILKQKSIKDIAFHSDLVVPGGAFFVTEYIEEYLLKALTNGAKFIVSTETILNLPSYAENIIVDNVREALGIAANFLYPEKPKYIVAVTGTNGKTSIVDYFRQICGIIGIKAASIGTMGVLCNDKEIEKMLEEQFPIDLTTPDVITIYKILNILAKSGVTHVAIEASSHGIDQLRIAGLKVHVAIFTNFSQDHLDYHGTMEEYKRAKLKLFSQNLLPEGTVIIGQELLADTTIRDYLTKSGFANENGNLLTVGKTGDLSITKIEPSLSGQEIEFKYGTKTYFAKFDIIGSFQSTNIVMTLATLEKCNIDISYSLMGINKIKSVSGRLERITPKSYKYHIFVDYAHKPFALESSLNELKMLCKGKLIVVFGCGGNRDNKKRKIMGEIATKIADIVIVTDDNPRTEDASSIRKQILEGAPDAIEIGERRDAISHAIGIMKTDDILLIAGKGHENYQIIGKEKIHFDDAEEVRKYI